MGLYAFYERHVFPRFMDRAMRGMAELRPAVLEEAAGDVLEVGFGTGLNLPHYPSQVRSLTGIDPLAALPERVEARLAAAPFPVERLHLPADERLPFEADRFDCVTMTWTLCSIPEPLRALAEVRRVLRPGGRLLFIEHGRSRDPRVARWQDRLNGLHRFLSCGCNLNRRMDVLLEEAGFGLDRLDRFELEDAPRIFAETYRGAAR